MKSSFAELSHRALEGFKRRPLLLLLLAAIPAAAQYACWPGAVLLGKLVAPHLFLGEATELVANEVVLVLVLGLVAATVYSVFLVWMGCALFSACDKALADKPARGVSGELAEVRPRLWPVLWFYSKYAPLAMLGCLFFLIPGMYLAAVIFFGGIVSTLTKRSSKEVFSLSWSATYTYLGDLILLLLIVLFLATLAGLTGWLFGPKFLQALVGSVVSLPAQVYATLFLTAIFQEVSNPPVLAD